MPPSPRRGQVRGGSASRRAGGGRMGVPDCPERRRDWRTAACGRLRCLRRPLYLQGLCRHHARRRAGADAVHEGQVEPCRPRELGCGPAQARDRGLVLAGDGPSLELAAALPAGIEEGAAGAETHQADGPVGALHPCSF